LQQTANLKTKNIMPANNGLTSREETPDLHQLNEAENFTLGQYLKNERQRRHISIEELHDKTGIHSSALTALENDQRHELPAEVFVRGFIKLYAQAIDLDPKYALALHQKKIAPNHKTAEAITKRDLLSSESLAESPYFFTGKKLFAALLCALLIILAYLLYHYQPLASFDFFDFFGAEQQISPLTAPQSLPSSVSQLNNQSLPEPRKTEIDTGTFTETPAAIEPATIEKQQDVEEIEERPSLNNTNITEDLEADNKKEPDHQAFAVTQTAAEKTEDLPLNEPASKPIHTLTATFTEETWVRTVIDEHEIKEAIFKPGASATWQAEKKIEILLGNSGGTDLTFDGEPVKFKGASGKVVQIKLP
jgi:cytoskeleton protein RodZ